MNFPYQTESASQYVDHFRPKKMLRKIIRKKINIFRKGGEGGTLGSDVTLYFVGVFVKVWCRTMHVGAGLAPWEWYQSISGEILTHLKKKNIFLAQKLTELEHVL